MKTGSPISKPVMLVVAAGILLSVLIFKFGSPRPPVLLAENQAATNSIETSRAVANPVPAVPKPAPVILADGGLPPVIPVSLLPFLVPDENGSWLKDKSYLKVPRGEQTFGGVQFLLEGMLQLQGDVSEMRGRKYRNQILIPLADAGVAGTNIASAHLLGGTRYETAADALAGELVWHFADGTAQRSPLNYGNHVRDWTRESFEQPAHLPYVHSKVVWRTEDPTQAGRWLRLYRITLANPSPGKTVKQLELARGSANATLFIVALTLDPLLPGLRPDDSPDMEPADTSVPTYLDLTVQNSRGQPLPAAKIHVISQIGGKRNLAKDVTTDANGFLRLAYAAENLDSLDVSASHDDYGSRKMLWDVKAGDTIPANYVLKLGEGIRIGGFVVDEADNPVAKAKVSFHRFWQSNEDSPQKKGNHPDFSSQTVTTDSQGRFEVKGLPVELLDHISFEVKHPDFMGANMNVVGDSSTEAKLRAGTLKIVLRRGLDVHGLVTDESDQPLAGATVWSGEKYSLERQQTKTDGHGKFVFHNVNEGETPFSVTAAGHAPASKSFTVKADMAEIVFKLGAGKTIRGIVQDESGSPLDGVRVVLEGNGDIGRTYEFSTTTGADGRFVWDAAPAEPMQFYIGKTGYEQVRNKTLPPDADNVITLQKLRTVQGYVLDADTEKPITKFRVGVGRFIGDENFYAEYPGMKDYTDPNGMFKLTLDEAYDSGVKAEADDYAAKVEKIPDAQNGVAQVIIHLKPSASLHGIVISLEGMPLPGVSVAIVQNGPGNGFSLTDSHLRSWSQGSKASVTDAEGKFVLNSPPETGGVIVAVGESGFTSTTVEQVRANGTVVLQPYGRIEGTVKSGGQPAAGRELYYTSGIDGINTDFNGYKTTSDENGKFTFEKIPAGEGGIVRLVQTSPNSWTHSDRTSVMVEAGKTVQVNIGDSGAVITGMARFEIQPTNSESLNIEGRLSGAMPQQPSFNSSEESRAYYNSPQWRELMKQMKNYAFILNADGSFTVDDVAPGTYSLNITVRPGGKNPWEHQPIAEGSMPVTVPDSATPTSPIFIGEVLLKSHSPAQQ